MLKEMISNAVFTLVIVSVFRSCNSAAEYFSSCEDDVHLACTNKPFHDSLHDDGFSLLAEDTLAEHCSDILADIECKRNFLSNCDPSGFEAFALATDGVRDVLGELCNETTELRKAYHIHSSCLSSNADLYEECILNTADTGGALDPEEYDSNGSDITSGDSTIKRMCRFYEPFKVCITQATRTHCGDSAAQLVEQIIVRSASPAVEEKCSSKEK